MLERIVTEHLLKGCDSLSDKFWTLVNDLLAKVLVERAQGNSKENTIQLKIMVDSKYLQDRLLSNKH